MAKRQDKQHPTQAAYNMGRMLRTAARAKMTEFQVLSPDSKHGNFSEGYRNREDITTLPAGVMVIGSQNVLTNTFGRISSRTGYTLDGQANSANAGILSSYDWAVQSGVILNLRAYSPTTGNNGHLQLRTVDPTTSVVTWTDLLTNLTSARLNFAEFTNSTSYQSRLLFVNGTNQIYEWSGGVGYIKATSSAVGSISALNENTNVWGVTIGGSGYTQGDTLTVSGGTGATVSVTEVYQNAVATLSVSAGGTGYLVNDDLTITGGTQPCVVKVTSVSGGAVTGVSILYQGSGYTVGGGQATTGGSGVNCTLDILTVAQNAAGSVSLLTPGSGYSTGVGIATTGGTGTGCTINISTILTGYIEISGDLSVGQNGFYTSGGQLSINGNSYTYGAVVGQYMVGITPTVTGEPNGSLIIQPPKSTPNYLMTGLPTGLSLPWSNDLISVFGGNGGKVVIASYLSSALFISATNDYTTYGVGTGAVADPTITYAQGKIRALINQEANIYVSSGEDFWEAVSITFSSDLTKANYSVVPLTTAPKQGSQSQGLTAKIDNAVFYVSNEIAVNSLGRVDKVIVTPQISDMSFPIINDVKGYDFTDGQILFYQKMVYITLPKENIMIIYNLTNPKKPYWEAPQTLPFGRLSIINGNLYGHSYSNPETFQLFVEGVYNDNGHAINSIATFAYQNYGVRAYKKNYNRYYAEGYISANTNLNLALLYDYNGYSGQQLISISGTDTKIVQAQISSASLGKASLGKQPLGGDSAVTNINSTPPKFRVIKTFPRNNFYESQTSFSSNGINDHWEILAFGPDLNISSDLPVEITE